MTHEPSETEILDDLQTSIGSLITEFTTELAQLVVNLTTTRQRGLGFATHQAKEAQDAALRAERADLVELLDQALARGVLPSSGFTTGTGESPAPGNLAGINVEAEIWVGLTHLVRQLVRDQARRGICTLTRIPTEPLIGDLLVGLRALVWQTPNMPLLHAVHRDLTKLRDTTLALVDGNDRIELKAPCPHCDNPTLVVYFRDDLIRCDRHPKTGRYETCTCSDPLCECKARPIAFRHEWHRSHGGTKATSWYALRDRLNLVRTTDPKASNR